MKPSNVTSSGKTAPAASERLKSTEYIGYALGVNGKVREFATAPKLKEVTQRGF